MLRLCDLVVGPRSFQNATSFADYPPGRSMASEFSRGLHTMADEAELGDIKGTLEDVKRGNLSGVANAIDPDGDLNSVEDLKASARETDVREDVGKIKDLAGSTGDGIVETVNEPSSADNPAKKASDS